MPVTSSQGNTFGYPNARKVSIKKSRGGTSDNRLDSSTLSIPHGCARTYEDGLPDTGGGSNNPDGIVVTATVEVLGSPPAAGTTASFGGKTCKCTESQTDSNVGALLTGTATFTSDYDPDATDPANC